MAKNNHEEQWQQADEEVRRNLPPGVKLVHTLRGHTDSIGQIAWSPDGRMLASPSKDKTIRLWDAKTGECLHTLEGHSDAVFGIAWSPNNTQLFSGTTARDRTLRTWDTLSSRLLTVSGAPSDFVYDLKFSPNGEVLALAGSGGTLEIRNRSAESVLKLVDGHSKIAFVNSVVWIDSERLVSGGNDKRIIHWDYHKRVPLTVIDTQDEVWCVSWNAVTGSLVSCGGSSTMQIWDIASGRQTHAVVGHTNHVKRARFSPDGSLLASKSYDDTVRIWRVGSWSQLAQLDESGGGPPYTSLEFHPTLPLLATVGSDLSTSTQNVIHLYELDLAVLLRQPVTPLVTYTSAKVVLVGDSGIGKTGLGWRLAHGEFKEHSSTHGQQFWLLNQLCITRRDGTQCEAVLWDLAGQSDYRLIHALFLDDTDLALVLFDPSRHDDPLSGVEFWLKQLRVGIRGTDDTPTVLIAARTDRGTPRLTREELEAFCKQRGIKAYLPTSAKTGEGIQDLIQQMQSLIAWDNKLATVTTETFKRIKDFVLGVKENPQCEQAVLKPEELRERLEETDRQWKFSDGDMQTAVGHLANHGYVTRLKTSRGDPRILLAPELLNNLAASIVLEARRNQKGLGSLEEERLLTGGCPFPELDKLAEAEKDILVDSAVVLFLEHNVCFRETDPHNGRAYLVFPELINLKRPLEDDAKPLEDGVAYTVSGAVENVYASLVVLMGYTQTFTRTNQWQNHARYEVGNGQVCGFRRLEAERAGELDFVLYFVSGAPPSVRQLFQSLFENFLARRNLTVRRFEPVACTKGHPLNRAVIREQMTSGAESAFCSRCGEKIILPKADQPIQLTQEDEVIMATDRRAADRRSRFEQVLFRLKSYAIEEKITAPECFISYAWDQAEYDRWVEKSLATDLRNAGIAVVLDRWETRIGASVPRYIERVAKTDRVLVVGTPLYRKKYDNNEPMRGFIVAAEGDLIGKRMIGSEARKESVLPVLLDGTEESAFPHLLHGRVYADFRRTEAYFDVALDLLLSLYGIQSMELVATELRESLKGSKA